MNKPLDIFVIFCLVLLSGCLEEESAPHGNGQGYGLINYAPELSGPVISPVEVQSLKGRMMASGSRNSVGRGTRLADWNTLTWNEEHSSAMCSVGTLFKSFYTQASRADRTMCRLRAFHDSGVVEDPVLGSRYILAYKADNDGFEMHLVLRKTQVNVVSSFKSSTADGAELEYLNYVRKNSVLRATVRAQRTTSPFGHPISEIANVTVEGKLKGLTQWTSKEVNLHRLYQTPTDSASIYSKLRQHSNHVELWSNNPFEIDGFSFFSIFDLIGSNSPTRIAIGDGSVKVRNDTGEKSYGWDGRTRYPIVPATNAAHFGSVSLTNLDYQGRDLSESWFPDSIPVYSVPTEKVFREREGTNPVLDRLLQECDTYYVLSEDFPSLEPCESINEN